MKICEPALQYYLKAHYIKDISVRELMELERRSRMIRQLTWACLLILTLIAVQGYINRHPYGFSELSVSITRMIGDWSAFCFVVVVVYTTSEWMRLRYVTYGRLRKVYNQLNIDALRFTKYFGKKTLTHSRAYWLKYPFESMLIKQMGLIIVFTKLRKYKEQAEEEKLMREMFLSATEFCPTIGYNALLNRAKAAIMAETNQVGRHQLH